MAEGGGRTTEFLQWQRACLLITKERKVSHSLDWSSGSESRALETSTAGYTQGAHVFTLKLQGHFHILPTGQPFSCSPIGQLCEESYLRHLVAQSHRLSLTDHTSHLPTAVTIESASAVLVHVLPHTWRHPLRKESGGQGRCVDSCSGAHSSAAKLTLNASAWL